MARRTSIILILVAVLAILISLTDIVSIVFWDNIFMFSLICLIIGGFLYLLEGGIFNNLFHSFKRFYKGTSKLQKYVSEAEYKEKPHKKSKLIDISIAINIFKIGLFLMLISMTISYFFYYR